MIRRPWFITAVLTFATMALLTFGVACSDTPAGSNSEADPKSQKCNGIPLVQIIPIAYDVPVTTARVGLIYDLYAYLLTGSCNPVAFVDPNLKITTIVIDGSGARRDPILNSADKGSPFKELVLIPQWPGRFGIQLIAEANVTRDDVANGNVQWVACLVMPRADTAPVALDIDVLTSGHGVAECEVIQ